MAPSDPRFLSLTPLEILTEYYANKYWENPKALDAVEDEDFNLEEQLALLEQEAADEEADVASIDDWEDLSS